MNDEIMTSNTSSSLQRMQVQQHVPSWDLIYPDGQGSLHTDTGKWVDPFFHLTKERSSCNPEVQLPIGRYPYFLFAFFWNWYIVYLPGGSPFALNFTRLFVIPVSKCIIFLSYYSNASKVTKVQGRIQDLIRGGPQIMTSLKLPFWGLSFVEFWCWGLIFGGRGGARAPGAPPWIRP